MGKKMKKQLAWLLCVALCFSLLPAWAFAEGEAETEGAIIEEFPEAESSGTIDEGDMPEEGADSPIEETSAKEAGSEAETDATAPTELTEDAAADSDKTDDIASTPENSENDADTPVEESTDNRENEIEDIVIEEEDEVVRNSNVVASGKCGNDLFWELDEDGVLTISGTGKMTGWWVDVNYSYPPWWEYRSSITSVYMEGGTTIGDDAFYGCTNLKNVTILTPITSIGQGAFRFCDDLTEIYIPETVTSIGYFAFKKCRGLKHVNLPERLNSLGFEAFYCCESLEAITIPGNVKQIEGSIFSGCSALESVIISEGVEKFVSSQTFSGCPALTNVTIPGSMKNIGAETFLNCSALQHITIPGSVEEIKASAFENSGLTEIAIPSSVKTIGQSAFKDCTGLTSLTLSNGLTAINEYTFSGCSALKSVSVPGTVTEIGKQAFYKCSSLTDVTLQEGITSIGTEAFMHCGMATLGLPESLTKMGDRAFCTCRNLKAVTIPRGVSNIPVEAFSRCSGLSRLTLENGLNTINQYAFHACSSLTDVTIPESVTSIGNGAFKDCSALKRLMLSEGLASISQEAFSGSGALTAVTIPGSVSSIGKKAFYKCSALSELTLQDGVGEIGEDAFRECSMNSLSIPGTVKIGFNAFYSCRSLKTLIIRDGVKRIADGAFYYCTNLKEIRFLGARPEMSSVFYRVTANAYYPEGKGWTADDLQNYGGTLKWFSFDPTEYDPSAYAFQTTLNLADYTGVFVYIGLPEGADASAYTVEASYHSYRQNYTMGPVALNTLPKGSGARAGMYKFEPLRAASTELSDTVTVTLKKSGTAVKVEEYSVRSIAETRLAAGELSGDAATLHRALLQYGRYGQLVFNNRTDDLPGTEGAPALLPIPAAYAAKGDPTNFGAYVTKFEGKLDLNSAISMNLYLTPAKGYSRDSFQISVLDKDGNAYSKYSVTTDSSNRIRVRIEGILSPQMARNFRVVVTLKSNPARTATWTRSVLSCAYTTEQANANANVKSLMQALYQYYVYAARVFPQYA